MKGLDLRGFQKVQDDKNSATLKHPKGHEVRIAKGSLSPSLREQLEKIKMAEGGTIQKKEPPKKTIQQTQADKRGDPDWCKCTSTEGDNKECRIHCGPKKMAEGGPMKSGLDFAIDNMVPDMQPQQPAAEAAPVDYGLPPNMSGLGLTSGPSTPQVHKQSRAPAAPMDSDSPEVTQDQPSDMGAPNVGPQQPSTGPTPIQDHSQDDAGSPQSAPQPQDVKQELLTEDQAWHNDLTNGHITPETYGSLFAKKDTLGKIGTIFGMMMSGAGSGLSHQPNALLGLMNNQIKNDLDAQIQSKGNAQNFLKMNQQQQMNTATITQMVKQGTLTEAQAKASLAEANQRAYATSQMQMNRAALHKLTQDAMRLPPGSPQRKQAEANLAMMFQAVNTENFGIADRASAASALSQFGNQSGDGINPEQDFQRTTQMLRMSGNDKLADSLEEHTVPGIKGRSSIKLNPDDRGQINSGITFQQQLDRFSNWTKNHSGDLKPADIAEGMALSAGLNNSYRQATHGGVYKSSEADFIGKVIDEDPTKFFNSVRVMPKLNAVKQDSSSQLNQLLKSKGLPGYQDNTSGAGGGQTKTVGGVTYRRGPNGEAIRVK